MRHSSRRRCRILLPKAKDTVAAVPAPPPARTGRITVRSTPDSAEVIVDSIAKGESPLTVDSLQQGIHVLIIRKKGYFGKRVTVKVAPDSTIAVAVSLIKPGRLVLKSEPDSAKVFIDGKESGVTPYDNAVFKPGDHVVRCEKDRFDPFEKQIYIAEGAADTLSIALKIKVEKDTVVKKEAAVSKKSRNMFDKVTTAVVAGLFVVFGIVLFSIEIEETSR